MTSIIDNRRFKDKPALEPEAVRELPSDHRLIAAATGVPMGSVSMTCDALEKKGYIRIDGPRGVAKTYHVIDAAGA